jgi:3,4-dihydroxy 2-butanone 4-phosphate synthase/GTP cyclohydrolase II
MVIYLQQEGRGIGLDKKIAAYHAQEMLGLDTVDANRYVGAPDEARSYECVPAILDKFAVGSIKLMTNNPYKLVSLRRLGVQVVCTVSTLSVGLGERAAAYLATKQARMAHSKTTSGPGAALEKLAASPSSSLQDALGELLRESGAGAVAAIAPATVAAVASPAMIDSDRKNLMLTAIQMEIAARRRMLQDDVDGLPFTTLTYAQCLDGSIAGASTREQVRISGAASMVMTHQIRAMHDGILVGVGTVLADDPLLSVRLASGRDPRPCVVDPHAR